MVTCRVDCIPSFRLLSQSSFVCRGSGSLAIDLKPNGGLISGGVGEWNSNSAVSRTQMIIGTGHLVQYNRDYYYHGVLSLSLSLIHLMIRHCGFHLCVTDLQMRWIDLTIWQSSGTVMPCNQPLNLGWYLPHHTLSVDQGRGQTVR